MTSNFSFVFSLLQFLVTYQQTFTLMSSDLSVTSRYWLIISILGWQLINGTSNNLRKYSHSRGSNQVFLFGEKTAAKLEKLRCFFFSPLQLYLKHYPRITN